MPLNAAAPRDAVSAAIGTINHFVRSTTQHRMQKPRHHHHKQRYPGGTSPSQPQTTLTTAAHSKTRVLLQTAQTFAFSVGNLTVPVRILFDNGSQRSYITEKLKGKLSLTPIRQETLYLNVFGSESCSRRKCDVVRLNLQGRDEVIEVVALSFPRICSPLPRHVELHPLDEASDSSDATVDVLIGSDYYWDVVEGETI